MTPRQRLFTTTVAWLALVAGYLACCGTAAAMPKPPPADECGTPDCRPPVEQTIVQHGAPLWVFLLVAAAGALLTWGVLAALRGRPQRWQSQTTPSIRP